MVNYIGRTHDIWNCYDLDPYRLKCVCYKERFAGKLLTFKINLRVSKNVLEYILANLKQGISR